MDVHLHAGRFVRWALVWAFATAAALPSASAQELEVGPEFALPEGPPAPQRGSLRLLGAASGADGWLVLWEGRESGHGPLGLMATRIAADGTLRDPFGVPLVTRVPSSVSVAFNGEEWLVLYDDSSSGRIRLRGLVVQPDGELRDHVNYDAGEGAFHAAISGLSWNGSSWVLTATIPTSAGSSLRAVLLSPNGEVEKSVELASAAKEGILSAKLTWNGASGLVTYYLKEEVRLSLHGIVLSANAEIGAQAELVPADFLSGFSTAFNGESYLVSWSNHEQVFMRRFSASGTALDANATLIASSAEGPQVVSGGSAFLVCFHGTQRTGPAAGVAGCVRVSGSGELLDPTPVVLAEDPFVVDLAQVWNGSAWIAATRERAFRLSPDGTAPVGIETFSFDDFGRPSSPEVLTFLRSGSQLLLASQIYYGGAGSESDEFYEGAAVLAQVTPADAPSLRAHSKLLSGGPDYQHRPRIASNGRESLVVWEGDHPLTGAVTRGARVTNDGRVLDLTPINLSPPPSDLLPGLDHKQPELAWNGERWLVAWNRFFRSNEEADVGSPTYVAALMAPSEGDAPPSPRLTGVELPRDLLQGGGNRAPTPKVACAERYCFVGEEVIDKTGASFEVALGAYELRPADSWDGTPILSQENNIAVWRRNADGTLARNRAFKLADHFNADDEVHVGPFNGEHWLIVAASRSRSPATLTTLRLTKNLQVAGAGPVVAYEAQDAELMAPVASWNGTHWLVAFQTVTCSASPCARNGTSKSDIQALSLSADGKVNTPAFPVAQDAVSPALSPFVSGPWLIAYEKNYEDRKVWDPSQFTLDSSRIGLRLISSADPACVGSDKDGDGTWDLPTGVCALCSFTKTGCRKEDNGDQAAAEDEQEAPSHTRSHGCQALPERVTMSSWGAWWMLAAAWAYRRRAKT